VADRLIVGDILAGLEDLITAGEIFDLILLDNVLEHVLQPLELLEHLHLLAAEGSVLIVEVPNDFSPLQEHLVEQGCIPRESWVTAPDHISYFNRDGLAALCRQAGWIARLLIGDYPMALNLFNPATNYVADERVGKACHRARVAAENLFHDLSPDGTDALCQALGELGVGRQIIAFLQPDGAATKESGA
jgi:SAM-dependent methyltransferase